MTLQVDTKRLPLAVEAGAVFSLTTQTVIVPGLGGIEARYAKRLPQVSALISVGPDDAVNVRDIFRRQVGDRWAFTVRDWSDYVATDELLIPESDGTYPLTRQYGDIERPSYRAILLPEAGTLVVKLDGVEATSGSYTLLSGGIIQPSSSWAAYSVTASFQFFVPMRFDGDKIEITVPAPGVLLVQQFNLLEVFG